MIIFIDATNLGIGGGITHLKELLYIYISNKWKFRIIVLAQKKVISKLPVDSSIQYNTHKLLNKSLIHRLIFQLFVIDKLIPNKSIVFSISGDYLGKYKPVVGMSQNMLLYERNNWKEIKQLKEIFRFWLNFNKQRYSFKNSTGIIFLSKFAEGYISKQLNIKNKQTTVIHHGISARFQGKVEPLRLMDDYSFEKPFKLLYVSTVHTYKHQWNVVKAVSNLRSKGYAIAIDLVGGVIFEPAGQLLLDTINIIDPQRRFINYHEHIPYEEIDSYYKSTDGIVFASTCENMPNILIESMASGKPIACSKKQPMPEFLKKNGFYFDAYNIDSIANAIEELLLNPTKRQEMAQNNLEEVKKYSWAKTADQTFKFIEQIYQEYHV